VCYIRCSWLDIGETILSQCHSGFQALGQARLMQGSRTHAGALPFLELELVP
jgi:hypothetical protein